MKNITALFSSFFFLPLLANAQTITTIAGTGTAGYTGNNVAATIAELNHPNQITTDGVGNLYIADKDNNLVRVVNTSGIIYTIAGTGILGYSGDGGPATAATISHPSGIAVDPSGNVYFSKSGNNIIRRVSVSGIISTIAGNGSPGYSGNGGAATLARINNPQGITLDPSGNLYIADYSNNVIRMVNTSGIISTIAGNGTAGYSGDGGMATLAQLNGSVDVTIDGSNNIYIADGTNSCIRKINISGVISTIAGNGVSGYNGDGIIATSAKLYNPFGIITDPLGNLYICDQTNNRIRIINNSGIITTIAGNGTGGYSGDNGPATSAELNIPSGICLDASGNIIIVDQFNNRIRRILECSNQITNHPINDTVISGDTAKYWVTSTMAGATYQWQENSGSGFVNLTNVLPYSGVNTDTLKIHNVIPIFNHSLYRCIVSNGTQCVDTSNTAILIVNNFSGIQAITTQAIDIFPNPAQNNIIIKLPKKNLIGNIQLVNEMGQSVIETTFANSYAEINIASLPPALYFVRIFTNNQTFYKKIIKY